MAAEEGQVIGCHSLEQFTLNLDNAKETQKLIVIDFTATWCGPCRAIAPMFTEWAKKYPHVLFLKVDVDEMQVIAQEMKVEAMPTFVFMKDGKEIDRVVGGHKDKILAIIAKHPPSASAGASSGTATA